MINLKNIIIIVFVLSLAFFAFFKSSPQKDPYVKPTIAVSTFALYDIAKHVASQSVEVFMILPFGVDIHSYEPTPKDMVKITNSKLVLYNGAGLEPWIKGVDFKFKAIDVSKHVELKELKEEGEESHHGDLNHQHGNMDPHYWQDIQNMIKAAELIAAELTLLFPQNSKLYSKNRDSYIDMLKKLDAEYKNRLSTCKLDTIIVNHNAFSYLAQRYGFGVEALSGLSPEAEPNAKNMIKLIKHVKEHHVGVIFFENFASDKAIKSIANEAKIKVGVLQPLGNITADEASKNLSYRDIMMNNLQKISEALECK